jgi:hypothetical protein
MLHLLFQKYVLALHWVVELHHEGGPRVALPTSHPSSQWSPLFTAVHAFLDSVLLLAERQVQVGSVGGCTAKLVWPAVQHMVQYGAAVQ